MEVASNNYLPSDPRLIEQIVYELKSQGIFDQFRKECISDVDTKPAYQNLRQRVEGSVLQFLKHQTWRPDMNKNQVREQLRKNIHESGYLETGVERIVDQVVNPKINTVFLPQVEEVVYKVLGIEKPNKGKSVETKKVSQDDLLPTDLEAVSPESTHMDKKDDSNLNDSQNLDDSKAEEDESPPFEPLEEENSFVVQEDNSIDSHMSGFSGMASHDSNHSIDKSMQMDCANQDSHISQNSSESRLSIVTSDENTRTEQCDDTSQSKLTIVETVNATDSSGENAKKSEEKSKSRSDDKRSRGSSDKSRSRDSKDKDKDRKSSSSKDKDHRSRHSSTSRDKDKDKDKVKDKKDYKSSSSSSKDRSDKNDKSKSQNRHSSSNSSSKDKDKSSSKSGSSSSRDKDKSRSSSSNKSNDKIRSSSSDKNRKHSSSSSSSRKDKDKKRDSKKDKDDHYSSKDKKSGRRSTDRDSNDGQSSKHGSSSGSNGNHSSQSQKSNADSTESPNGNGTGDSGNSDQIVLPSDSLAKIPQETVPKVKLYKPKFASNIHEARKLMKIRKQLAKLEKQSQLGLVSFEPVAEVTPVVNGIIEEPEVMQVVEEEVLQSKEISKENWEALEARLYQEMSTVNFNSYESPDDDTEQVVKSPVKTVIEENLNECRYLEAPGAMETNKQKWLKTYIEKLENSTVNNRGRKRKFEDFTNNNDRKKNFEESNKQLKTQNNTKVNKIKITDFIPSDSFTLPLSPADSDKSNDKKEDLTEISVKQRRNATPKNIRQRYSSEDLYKPRPVFASSRRRGARNKDE